MRIDLGSLLKAADAEPVTVERARQLISNLDLTTLSGNETKADVEALCSRAVDASVAAVCIFPSLLSTAVPILRGSSVKLATVANFPTGSDDLEATADEVSAAVEDGAEEVDIVAPIEAAIEGDVSLTGELVSICRAAIGPSVGIKIILETGRLRRPELITAVARSAVMAGADFLKTSTGKTDIGATPETASLLFAVALEAEGQVGVKISGGVRTAADAQRYWRIGEAIVGQEQLRPERFRIGASKLLDELEKIIPA